MASRFLSNGAPMRCASCSEPFPVHDGRLEAWRLDARYFCTGCAERDGRHLPQSSSAAQRAAPVRALAVRSSTWVLAQRFGSQNDGGG
jgi:hypothetical protein